MQTNTAERGKHAKVSAEKKSYSDYFGHNGVIVGVLSLFCGFIFTSITILLTALQNKQGLLAQSTILFLTLIFYFSLYVLLDNLEMAFHYIDDIPPLTLKVRPFFNLLLIFYFFGTSTVLMFLLFDLWYLAAVSAVVWVGVVVASINLTVKRFYNQSIVRYWPKKKP
jgi:Na+-transporting NADH:ubiquinone oxidoreductase subunit NqrC